jgi:MFS family permease
MAAAWLGDRLPRRTTYLTGVLISGPTRLIVLAIDCPPTLVLAVYALAGIGSGFFNPAVRSTMAEVAPTALRGRVFALVDALGRIGLPAAGLLTATSISAAGLTGTLWLFGTGYLLAVLYPARHITRNPARQALPIPGPGADPSSPPPTATSPSIGEPHDLLPAISIPAPVRRCRL